MQKFRGSVVAFSEEDSAKHSDNEAFNVFRFTATKLGLSSTRWGILALLTAVLTVAPRAAQAQVQYGTWLHPFAAKSIWNSPVDWNSQGLTSLNLPEVTSTAVDQQWFKTTTNSDGPYTVLQINYSGSNRGTTYMPSGFIDKYLNYISTNGIVCALQPDGNTYSQISNFIIDPAASNPNHYVLGVRGDDDSISNDGLFSTVERIGNSANGQPPYRGAHFGSSMTGLGGAVRWEEWSDSSQQIEHALQLELPVSMLNYNASLTTPGYVWPAKNTDDQAYNSYKGTNAALKMGSYLAIDPGANIALETPEAQKLLYALKKYGGYVVDTAGDSTYQFGGDTQVSRQLANSYGDYGFLRDSAWHRDEEKLFRALGVLSHTPNVALRGTVTSSSNWSADYGAANAVDGNVGGYNNDNGWSVANGDTSAWLMVDLGRAYPIKQINLVTRFNVDQVDTRRNFAIWASNNPNMSLGHVVLATQGNTPLNFRGIFTANITDTTFYRYVAVVKTDGAYMFIGDLQVLADATGPYPVITPGGGGSTTSGPPIGQTIGFKAANTGLYVSTDQNNSNNFLRAAWAGNINTWEQFTVVDAQNGYIALKSSNGYYVSCNKNNNNRLMAQWALGIGDWEKFTWENRGNGQFALKAKATGYYVSSDLNDNKNLRAGWAGNVGDWEKFSR